MHSLVRKPLFPVSLGHFVGQHRPERALKVGRQLRLQHHGSAVLQRWHRFGDEVPVNGSANLVVLHLAVDEARVWVQVGSLEEERAEVEAFGLVVHAGRVHRQPLRLPHHLVHVLVPEARHVLTHLFREEPEEVHNVLGFAAELFAEFRVLGGDADGAGVEVALAHHDAAQRDQGRGGKAKLFGPEQRSHHHIATILELPVRLEADPGPEPVEHKSLVRLGQPQLPRQARPFHPSPRCGPRAAVAPGNGHVVGLGFCHPRRHHAHPHLGHELHAHVTQGLRVLQVVDELRQVLNRVDVVVGRGRDQTHTRRGAPALPNVRRHLETRQLATLTGFRPLRHLDLDLVAVCQVVRGDPETARRHLLDGRPPVVEKTHRVLPAFARVAARLQPVHGDGQGFVRLLADAAQAHGAGDKALHNRLHRLHLVQGHGRVRGVFEVKLEQAAKRHPCGLLVHQLRVGPVRVSAVVPGRVLEGHHVAGGV
mmetsp:Transcript_41654/g.70793  ORF Transcript_41654/g.70793 Transcript_41654/m.70793 type:complete len:480 (-) Transcript_41654:2701-4140(-)